MAKDKFLSITKNDAGFGFCSVVFGWDSASSSLTSHLMRESDINDD